MTKKTRPRGPGFDYVAMAQILAESAFFGHKRTAEKHGITTQTIRNYHRRLNNAGEEGERLRQLTLKAKNILTERWADRLAPAILRAIEYIEDAMTAAAQDPAVLKSHEMLYSVTGAAKLLGELQLSERMLNARLADTVTTNPAANRSLAAPEEAPDDEQRH